MNLPIDVVVELLMANYTSNGMGVYSYQVGRKAFAGASSIEELATKVRTYLQSLVPAPKLLSECEEWKQAEVEWSTKAYRNGDDAYSDDDQWIGKASLFKVIQPVEVPNDPAD